MTDEICGLQSTIWSFGPWLSGHSSVSTLGVDVDLVFCPGIQWARLLLAAGGVKQVLREEPTDV